MHVNQLHYYIYLQTALAFMAANKPVESTCILEMLHGRLSGEAIQASTAFARCGKLITHIKEHEKQRVGRYFD